MPSSLKSLVALAQQGIRQAQRSLDKVSRAFRPVPVPIAIPVQNKKSPFQSSYNRFNLPLAEHSRYEFLHSVSRKLWAREILSSWKVNQYRFVGLNDVFGARRSFSTANAVKLFTAHASSRSRASHVLAEDGDEHGFVNENAKRILQLISKDKSSIGTCVVEFRIRQPQFEVAGVSFLDDDFVSSLESSIKQYKRELSQITQDIKTVSETFGSVPVKVEEGNYIKFKMIFADTDVKTVEQYLVDAQITTGVVSGVEFKEVGPEESGSAAFSGMAVVPQLSESSVASSSVSSGSIYNSYPILSDSTGSHFIRDAVIV